MRFIAVDPGLAATGVVFMDGKTLVRAETWKTPADGPTPDFASVMRRGRELSARLVAAVADFEPGAVVIEAYEDIPGRLRGARLRWTTPAVAALLGVAVSGAVPVVWQSPKDVMTRYSRHKAHWASGRGGLLGGDALITNDHERSAACHALAYLEGGRQ